MKARARSSYKRMIIWDVTSTARDQETISQLDYFVNGELIGRIETDVYQRGECGSGGNHSAEEVATYVPYRFYGSDLEITVKSTDGKKIVGSTRFRSNRDEIELPSGEATLTHGIFQPETIPRGGQEQRASVVEEIRQRRRSITTPKDNIAFFTICSKNFLAYARVLWRSLRPHYPERRFYVVLCDRVDGYFDPGKEPFEFIYLEDLELPDLEGMARRYNITEFNTSVKPFAFKLLFEKFRHAGVIYLDPDIIAVTGFSEVDELLVKGVPGILTPHLLQPAERDEVHEGKMLLFGIYNLGFLALSNTPAVGNFLDWWGRRLERQCSIDLANGVFVDQKWADLLPSFVSNVHILRHPGYNVAYWNLPQRSIRMVEGEWRSNELPLRFVHFSGNSIDEPAVFSRHSQQVTLQSIGELRTILDHFRELVHLEGHHIYRKMPYAYSWSGEKGVNLHTPASLDKSKVNGHLDNLLQSRTSDGARLGPPIRLLYMDWGVPKPDVDAGSVTASIFLKVFLRSGVDVTFLPGSLIGEEPYAGTLRSTGVRIITAEHTASVFAWITDNAKEFDIFFLSRGPVCGPYIDLIKECAPNAKVVFNTVDLHYLREAREAGLLGDGSSAARIEATKRVEFDLITKADATIVLSTEEVYEVRRELTQAKLSVIPIVFEDVPGSAASFGLRKDIVFIGSFPHKPNIDAVIYFSKEIFPVLQSRLPNVRFLIVGANPPAEILALGDNPGIEVLGFVKDLGDVFNRVRLSVAPLRYGAGIKGKIGTSFCYGVPCVATPVAVEGMNLYDGVQVLVGRSTEEFVDAVVKGYLDDNLWNKLSRNGLQFVQDNYSVSEIGGTLTQLVKSLHSEWRQIEGLYQFAGWGDWNRHCDRIPINHYLDRENIEQNLLPIEYERGFMTDGYCCICKRPTQFLTSNMYSVGSTPDGRAMPNWREHLQCKYCLLVNRVRAAIHSLHVLALPGPATRIYITEQLTQTYNWLSERYPKVVGSEYFGPNCKVGETVSGVRNENVMNLSFADRSFDRVVSLDVLEHVPDPIAAFRELYRILDDEGILLFSVPFTKESERNIVRAIFEPDGSIRHMAEPEYHGNPVDPEGGALCFQYFGWEVLDQLRSCGFKQAHAYAYWSPAQGYLGCEQFIFKAKK